HFWVSLPLILWQLYRSARRFDLLSRTFAEDLRREQLPAFARETAREASEDLTSLQTPALLERLECWTRRTLHDFARDSLKPTALAGVALGKLQQALTPSLGPERARAVLGELTLRVRPDAEADLAGAVRELAAGRLDRDTFLQRFGHRGSQEMELAQPRWSEEPAALDRLLVRDVRPANSEAEPTALVWARVAAEARLSASRRSALEGEVRTLQTYLGLRETAKHYFMMGYALIRRVLVELDRRYRLAGGIFYLIPGELPRLAAGEDLSAVIAQRRRHRAVALSLEVPQVLFSDNLDAIGRPIVMPGASVLQGTPLSAGVAEGEALVLHEPTAAAAVGHEAYVLVCPSTDPAWVPLFLRARALVMEMGGVLSHGAIVAREFGLPAVAGLPDIHRRLRSGQRLRVDGATGTVTVLPS
ncbi:MAG TPA: PEP-utilizing enzyme, partial [Gemmataceae bacterium]|nr:PEP-utilizing enzyme [Gemmataceae bacterium]